MPAGVDFEARRFDPFLQGGGRRRDLPDDIRPFRPEIVEDEALGLGGQPGLELVQPFKDPGRRVPGVAGFFAPLKDQVSEDFAERRSLGRRLLDPPQEPGEGVLDEVAVFEGDLEVRGVAQVDGRGAEDHGREAVDRLHLEIGVAGEDLLHGRLGPAGELLFRHAVIPEELVRHPPLARESLLEPGQDPFFHLPGGVPGEGDGQDVGQAAGHFARRAGFQEKIGKPAGQGVCFSRPRRGPG